MNKPIDIYRLYSDAVREMVKHCKIWGYDDSNEVVVDNYLTAMRDEGKTLPSDVIDELEYTNINKNDYHRLLLGLTYDSSFSLIVSSNELINKSIKQVINEHIADCLITDPHLKSLKIDEFGEGSRLRYFHIPFTDLTIVSFTGNLGIVSNNVYAIEKDADFFPNVESASITEQIEPIKEYLIRVEPDPKVAKSKKIKFKKLELVSFDVQIDSSFIE